jgi:hypothetical protein
MTPEQKQLIREAKAFRDILRREGMRITNRFSFVGDIVIILENEVDDWLQPRLLNLDNLSNFIAERTERYPVIDWSFPRRWFHRQKVMNIWLYRENPHHD